MEWGKQPVARFERLHDVIGLLAMVLTIVRPCDKNRQPRVTKGWWTPIPHLYLAEAHDIRPMFRRFVGPVPGKFLQGQDEWCRKFPPIYKCHVGA